jgi:hypothetical protein
MSNKPELGKMNENKELSGKKATLRKLASDVNLHGIYM